MLLRKGIREQEGKPLLEHLSYGQVADFPAFQEEVIPSFGHDRDPGYQWGARGGYETEEQRARPYKIPESFAIDNPEDLHGDLPALQGPTNMPWDYEPYVPPEQHSRRRPAKCYDELNVGNLTIEQIAVVRDWSQNDPGCSYHDQIQMIATSLRGLTPPATHKTIGEIFGVTKGTIINHMLDAGWTEQTVGRPSWLTHQESQLIQEFVEDCFDNQQPASYSDISDFVSREFHLEVPMKSIREHIQSIPGLKVIEGKPMDAKRLQCDPAAIDRYYESLERFLKNNSTPSALVMNLDETGHDDWGDKKKHKVVVPVNYDESQIEIPVTRESKRSTVLGAIAADGTCLRPLVVVPRKSIERELFQLGYTPKRVMYGSNESGFITTELFDEWARKELIPYVTKTRNELRIECEALLILDGCSCHGSDRFLDELTYYGIVPAFLPPHSSDQTQPLDLGIFALEKAEAMRIRLPDDVTAQTRQIVKAIGGYLRACVPNCVVSAFRQAGIVSDWNPIRQHLVATIDREASTRIRHWNLNRTRIPIEQLANDPV
jgi:hypothetical protein